MLAAALIAAGYLVLIATFGWQGLGAVLAHVFLLCVAACWLKGGTRARLTRVRRADSERGLTMTTKHRAAQRVYCAPGKPLPAPSQPPAPAPPTAPSEPTHTGGPEAPH